MTDPLDELRAAVAGVPPARPALAAYLAKVHERASAVADVERLRAAGLREDEIFEQTVAAAVAEGLRRLDAARAAIGG